MRRPASIRPRHIGRGDGAARRPRPQALQGFNSATAHRPWRLSLILLVISRVMALQFGHGTSAVETRSRTGRRRLTRTSFNSATAHRPWRQACDRGSYVTFNASIRPRHIGRGDIGHPSSSSSHLKLQFGHGTAAVETATTGSRKWAIEELQFGHGTSAVETLAFARWAAGQPIASIRPRHIGRGDATKSEQMSNRKNSSFNSATAHRPWRPQPISRGPRPLPELQFGHGTSAVETQPGKPNSTHTIASFNSATAHRPWRPIVTSDAWKVGWKRFNSATAHRPWRRACMAWLAAVHRLQFGHGTSAVETTDRFEPGRVLIPLQFGHGTSAVETGSMP